ncbi:MAG: hypothetical protein QOC81_3190 [Thermoanaerobaculia bacterium]|nr:hypothetical protein [Thermoanaerobaculia bacterium]
MSSHKNGVWVVVVAQLEGRTGWIGSIAGNVDDARSDHAQVQHSEAYPGPPLKMNVAFHK